MFKQIIIKINVSKTKFMCFHAPQKVMTYPILKINNINIERVTDFKDDRLDS